jgi:hypothetical protein
LACATHWRIIEHRNGAHDMNRRHAIGLLSAATALPALAAYDPKPEAALAAVLGEWHGTLTYRDYAKPDRTVALPTRLYISMLGPDELALHFAYDDGPGKTVYTYERLRFEFASDTLVWIMGAVDRTALVGRIIATANEAGVRRYVVDTTKDNALSRYTFEFSPGLLTMKKDEIDKSGKASNRNNYVFKRPA